MQLPDFRISRNDEPIQEVTLKYKLSTGIEVKDFPGIVPKFYERQACQAANYRYYHDWQDLTVEQKAEVLAHYFLENLMESHKSEVINDRIKKDQRKRAKG